MTDDKTPHGQWPLPHPSNKLSEDVTRIREAMAKADTAIKTLQTAMASANTAIAASAAAGHGHGVATPSANGFMAAEDKGKLDGIQSGATAYAHPASHPASVINQDANNRFFTDAERQKLSGIAANATAYAHPANHPASVITQDPYNRFVSDAEKAAWNAKMGVGAFGLGGAAVSVPDFNALTATGFYMGSGAPGAPNATGWWIVQNIVHNINWMVQTAWGFAGNEGQVVSRTKSNGNWTNWSGNMAGGIKSVQRGVSVNVQGTNNIVNVTISPVNLAKAFATSSVAGTMQTGNSLIAVGNRLTTARVRITAPTNLEIYSPFPVDCAWEVVEFN